MEQLVQALQDHHDEVKRIIAAKSDWKIAFDRMDAIYRKMADPNDPIWGEAVFTPFKNAYVKQKQGDKGMSNIVVRTISALPETLRDSSKTLFFEIAEVCCFFNASHKVNFASEELPGSGAGVSVIPAKTKGLYTYAVPTPFLYPKTSLTFDYWVPKFLEWTDEIRSMQLLDWKGQAILKHEGCTDFMRICLLFLSDPKHNPPIAKAEDREVFLRLFGKEYKWIRKSSKREDIEQNSCCLLAGFAELSKRTGMDIPLESWSRIQHAPFIKSLLK